MIYGVYIINNYPWKDKTSSYTLVNLSFKRVVCVYKTVVTVVLMALRARQTLQTTVSDAAHSHIIAHLHLRDSTPYL